MGLYDRDYYRDDSPTKRSPFSSLSAVAIIVILNVALYLADQLLGRRLFPHLALIGTTAVDPVQWYRCLTYGFAHDPGGFLHILCNMLVLIFFGPSLERCYGKFEFTLFFLTSIIVGGIVWNIFNMGANSAALGASGGITAVVILFALNYPRSQILLYGILPLPAWLAGVLFVLYDMFGARHGGDNVAHDIHLVGAVFAAVYFVLKLRLSVLFSMKSQKKSRRKKARKSADNSSSKQQRPTYFTVTTKLAKPQEINFEQLEAEVDRILKKISQSGEASLSEDERSTLRFASQEYQKRKN